MVNGVGKVNTAQSLHNFYVNEGVSKDFEESVFQAVKNLEGFSPAAKKAVSKLENVIILKDKESKIPDEFSKTENKFNKYATDAFGFVSKEDGAIVLVEDNHGRKNAKLEGDVVSQGADTLTHEVGHLIDDEFSTTKEFKSAYLADLKNIESMLNSGVDEILGEDLKDTLKYLKHYMEGVNFEDGIDESDITREGLRENFAECFSTIADSNPTKINQIYSSLFANTMDVTRGFVL